MSRTRDGDSQALRSQLHAFQSILALVIMTEYWSRLIQHWHEPDTFLVVSPVVITGLGVTSLTERWRRPAFLGIALVVGSFLAIVFPGGGNHEYLEFLLCLVCAGLDCDVPEERLLLRDSVRWMTGVILFWAGVQKLVHGFYFNGEYLAYSVSRETYASVFSWLLPAGELARLAALDGSAGTGPYVARDWLFSLVSNVTYILEIALAPLLLLRVTRRVALVGVFLLLLGIESAAREMFFFFVQFNMLLLFLDGDLNRRLIALIAVLLASMLLVRMGVLPEVTFT